MDPAPARRRGFRAGIPPLWAGVVAIAILVVVVFFAFTGANPFSHPFKLKADFLTANDLQPGTPVRVAGVYVGQVTSVKGLVTSNGTSAAEVTMSISKQGLPLHRDAELKIRSRLFLEGTYFIDVNPGTPASPKLHSGDVVPAGQTASPVQLGQVLTALQSDTRSDLQTFLQEYARGLSGAGARGYNRSIKWWVQAYRSTAIANTATLGTQPHDLSGVIRGQRDVFGALSANVPSLEGLVSNFATTASAFAQNSVQLGQTVPALRNLLRTGTPALLALDHSLPSLRSFAREALPGVRSSVPALKAGAPFVAQARGLVSPAELQGLAHDLRPTIPALARLDTSTIPFLEQSRLLSSCQNHVLLPFAQTPVPDPDFPANSGQPFYKQAPRTLVGLAGESRETDANGPLFRGVAVAGPITLVQPAEGGGELLGSTAFPPEGTRPGKPSVRPKFRPGVPCETQQPPDLNAPRGDADATVVPHPLPISALPKADQRFQREAGAELGRLEGALVRQREGLPYVSPLGVTDAVEAKELARIGFKLTPQGKVVPKKGAGK